MQVQPPVVDETVEPDFSVVVIGNPAPQGSKRQVRPKTFIEDNPETAPWRDSIVYASRTVKREGDPIHEACYATLVATFLRPRYHYRTGKFYNELKPSAPGWHAVKPDGDKIARAAFDALVIAQVIYDDALITEHSVYKRWANWGESPSLSIRIWTLQ